MADYPLGGMDRAENVVDSVSLFDTVFSEFTYVPPVADALDLAGLILARNIAGDKLVPYVAAQFGVDLTGTPVAVLGSNVQADAGPADVELRAIVSGQVRRPKLHTAAAPTTAITELDADRLRDSGIIPLTTTELSKLDN